MYFTYGFKRPKSFPLKPHTETCNFMYRLTAHYLRLVSISMLLEMLSGNSVDYYSSFIDCQLITGWTKQSHMLGRDPVGTECRPIASGLQINRRIFCLQQLRAGSDYRFTISSAFTHTRRPFVTALVGTASVKFLSSHD